MNNQSGSRQGGVSTSMLLRRYLTENGRFFGLTLLSMLGMYILAGLLLAMLTGSPDGHMGALMVGFGSFITMLCACYGGSVAFRDMGSRQGRIHVLMTPATPVCLIGVRLLIHVVVLCPLLLLFVQLADLVRLLLAGIMAHDIAPYFADYGSLAGYISLSGVLTLLFVQSIYIVGSICWPRMSFIKTSVLIMALGMLLVTIISGTVMGFAGFFHTPFMRSIDEHFELLSDVVMLVLTLFNYVLAWMRLCEADLIERPL